MAQLNLWADLAVCVQSAEARQHGGQVAKGSFASRAQASVEYQAWPGHCVLINWILE